MKHFANLTLGMAALGLALACNVAFAQKNNIVPSGGVGQTQESLKHQDCLTSLRKEMTAFKTGLENGIKGGRINALEKSNLEVRLLDYPSIEKRVSVQPGECNVIHPRVNADNRALQSALASASN